MTVSSHERVQHTLANALTKIDASLQLLEQRTPLSEPQRRLVNAAFEGLADLKSILQDDVVYQPTGLAIDRKS